MNGRQARAQRKQSAHRKHPIGPRGQQLLEEARSSRNRRITIARAKLTNDLRVANAAYQQECREANQELRTREAEIRRATQEGRLGLERVDA